jgi:uncharacterized protein YkwD
MSHLKTCSVSPLYCGVRFDEDRIALQTTTAFLAMVMNRIKPSWVGSICLTILLFLLCACSTTTGIQITSDQASAGATGATAQEAQIAQAVFQAINQSRAANGLPSLTWSNALANSARQHDLAMQAANTLSHQLPGEAAFGDRERQQGVNWSWAAENIGETSDQTVKGALGLHQAMMSEQPPDDGHRQNILTSSGNIVGIAILIDQQHGQLWLTEDFAHV